MVRAVRKMALSAFDDPSGPPQAGDLEVVGGASAGLREEVVALVTQKHGPITPCWNFARAKYGWSLRLKRKERVVLYMTPQMGQFLVGVVLGEKAAKAAHDAGLPAALLAMIDGAPRYAEGRGIRLAITSRADVLAVEQLAALKLAS